MFLYIILIGNKYSEGTIDVTFSEPVDMTRPSLTEKELKFYYEENLGMSTGVTLVYRLSLEDAHAAGFVVEGGTIPKTAKLIGVCGLIATNIK
jgi:hypothetical protein